MAVSVNNQLLGAGGPFTQTYTPTWSGLGTPPALGNGTISGRYFQIGKLVFLSITLTTGSTSTYGSSSWTFSLPVTAATTHKFTGSALVTDTGTGWYACGCRIESSTTLSPYYAFNGNTMTSVHPHTWATGDVLEITIVYEAA
jgi:hypothetical protein